MRSLSRFGLLTLLLACLACARPVVFPPALFPAKGTWTRAVDGPIEGPLASDGTRVYVATRDGKVRALDAATGQVVWTRALSPGTTVGAAGDVVVARETDGNVRRLAGADGRDLWSVAARVTGHVAPSVGGSRVFVAGDGVAALDAADGRLLWAAPGTPAVLHPPALISTQVVVVEADGTLRGRDVESGLPLWGRRLSAAAPPLAGENDRLFLGTSERSVLGLRARDGSRRWRWRLGADVDSTPALSGRRLLVATLEAVLYALDRGNGHMLWRQALPSRPLSSPLVIGEGVLVACRESDLVGFALADGARLGAIRTPGEMRTPPLLVGDRLVVGTRHPWVVTGLQLDLTPKKPQPAGARRPARPGAPGQPSPPAPGASPAASPAPATSPSAPAPLP